MKHFRDLYEFLNIDDDLGHDVFVFLTTFPPNDAIMAMVSYTDKSLSEIFPLEAPYKAMYSVFALKGVLSQNLQEGAPCHELVCQGIRTVSSALVNMSVPDNGPLAQVDAIVALALAECLLGFLKEPSSEATRDTYFEDPRQIVTRLGLLMSASLEAYGSETNARLVSVCFASILEASLHCEAVWHHVKKDQWTPVLLEKLWLSMPKEELRVASAASLRSVFSTLAYRDVVDAPDFV